MTKIRISKGNWSGEVVELVEHSDTFATTDDFEMEVRLVAPRVDDSDVELWEGTVKWDGDLFTFDIFKDGKYYIAIDQALQRENRNIFVALAQVAYSVI